MTQKKWKIKIKINILIRSLIMQYAKTIIKKNVSKEIFRKAIYENSHLFNNKIIMVIGCGTGYFVYISS
jgi:hypothetical protein